MLPAWKREHSAKLKKLFLTEWPYEFVKNCENSWRYENFLFFAQHGPKDY